MADDKRVRKISHPKTGRPLVDIHFGKGPKGTRLRVFAPDGTSSFYCSPEYLGELYKNVEWRGVRMAGRHQ